MRQSLALVLFTLPAVAFGQYSQFHFQHASPAPTLIKTGRILDVTSGKYLDHQSILTEGGRIKEVGPWDQVQAHAPKDAINIDLSQATVLPGLIDCHAHPFVSMDPHMSGGEGLTTAIALMSPTLRVFIGAHNLREDLEAGITSVRIVGHSGVDGDISLRDAINLGLVQGPRLQASGRKLTPLGGQSMYLQPALAKPILEQEYRRSAGRMTLAERSAKISRAASTGSKLPWTPAPVLCGNFAIWIQWTPGQSSRKLTACI